MKKAEIQAATTIIAAETLLWEFDVQNYNTLTIYFDYVLGDEDYYDLIPKFLRIPDGDEHQLTDWSTDANAVPTIKQFRLAGSIKSYIVLDVTGLNRIRLYGDATGGTPTGTIQLGFGVSSE